MNPNPKLYKFDLALALIVSIGLFLIFHETSLDHLIAGKFYFPTQTWIYRDNFLLEQVLHKGGVQLIILLFLILIARLVFIWRKAKEKKQKSYITFVLISSLLTIFSVFLLKRWSTFPCPWNSTDFGGQVPTGTLWTMFSEKLTHGQCFPSGHSSGGYGLLAFYFGYTFIYGNRKWVTILPGLIIGIVFGMTQQMRGAHFMSHDFATIIVSVLMSGLTILLFKGYYKKYEIKND